MAAEKKRKYVNMWDEIKASVLGGTQDLNDPYAKSRYLDEVEARKKAQAEAEAKEIERMRKQGRQQRKALSN